MINSTCAEILQLYRSFLHVIENWPADHLRPNRNLKQVLHLRVTEGFQKNMIINDPEVHNKLVTEAEIELDALKRLANNEFKEKYPLSDKMHTPASNPKYYTRLIAEIDKAAKAKIVEGAKKPSFWKRIFG
nr:12831_t:CDS:2 [Entrophospora candida]